MPRNALVRAFAHVFPSSGEPILSRNAQWQCWLDQDNVIIFTSTHFFFVDQELRRFTEITDESNRAQVYALIPVTFSIGVALGPLIGGQSFIRIHS